MSWRIVAPASLSGSACMCTMGTAARPLQPSKKDDHTLSKRGSVSRVRKPMAMVVCVLSFDFWRW